MKNAIGSPDRIRKWKLACMALAWACPAAWAQIRYPVIDTIPKQKNSDLEPVKFRKVKIQNTPNTESCAFGDFNGDGTVDIVSGDNWFEGPGFTAKHHFRQLSLADRTTPDDMTTALDVDHDGYDDVISGAHNLGLFWYRNPGKNANAPWVRDVIDGLRPNGKTDTAIAAGLPHNMPWHSGNLYDLDRDGKAEELVSTGTHYPQQQNMHWFKFSNGAWVRHDMGGKCGQFGGGVGDLNGDGRPDVLCPEAWFEAPEDLIQGNWIKHPFPINIAVPKTGEPEGATTNELGIKSGHTAQIYVYDVNKDGRPDFILGSAHGDELSWYEQTRTPAGTMSFAEHVIDASWYQIHNLEFKDVNGDGIPDLVTGKRYRGWGPHETDQPSNVYWYELKPGAANPWIRHVVSYDEGIGMGCDGDLRDFDKDGDMDILVTSFDKGGTNLFINQKPSVRILPRIAASRIDRGAIPVIEGWGQGRVLFQPQEATRTLFLDARGRVSNGSVAPHAP